MFTKLASFVAAGLLIGEAAQLDAHIIARTRGQAAESRFCSAKFQVGHPSPNVRFPPIADASSVSCLSAQKALRIFDWMRSAVSTKLVHVRAHGLAASLFSNFEIVILSWHVGC
jgi:hypothetical protein